MTSEKGLIFTSLCLKTKMKEADTRHNVTQVLCIMPSLCNDACKCYILAIHLYIHVQCIHAFRDSENLLTCQSF